MTPGELEFRAALSLKRLRPRLQAFWITARIDEIRVQEFEQRLEKHWGELFSLVYRLYGDCYDFFFHLENLLITAAAAWCERPERLRVQDHRRVNEADWYLSEEMVGAALYVELFSDNLGRLRESLDYLQDLGISYLHLMPLFAVRPGDNDGGYAISNYRSVDPKLGTLEDLRGLAADLHERGICLVLDFVFNHTADDHQWAQAALSGEREYQEFYYMFPDRTQPDRYEQTLREIFPTVRRGNFTWHDGIQRWIWTTFNNYQWDLNYANPSVFRAMAEEMFFIANTGVDVLRLDAVAFIWKRMGTSCENLPEAHVLIQAFNLLARIATPSLLFKSEAIVHPDEVIKYIGEHECQLSYNPTLMALLWESLATRNTRLLKQTLGHRHRLPDGCGWVNYLRCHDDIGWSFDDNDAWAVTINPQDHRRFLNAFYTGQFAGSFARGVPFQENPDTGDMRISGTMASLAGLEQAIQERHPEKIEHAIRRILLLHGIALSIGGIPLIYLGEEWGMLNDYDFVKDPAKAGDTRWIHRPRMQWNYLDDLGDPAVSEEGSTRARIFTSLRTMIALRRRLPALSGQEMSLINIDNAHLLAFVRRREGHRLLIIANFSEQAQTIDGNILRTAGLSHFLEDYIAGVTYSTAEPIVIDALQILWMHRV